MIRAATVADTGGVLAIWNDAIRNTSATFNPVEKTAEAFAALLEDKAARDHPFFVGVEGKTVLGFATYGAFRNGLGYGRTMEHSILLAPQAQGKGLGRGLMEALFAHGRAHDIHSLWAGVSGENPDGKAFHARLGFEEIAVLPEVGFKFGRWMDLTLMRKAL